MEANMNAKNIMCIVLCLLIIGASFFIPKVSNETIDANEYFRIHIRANSNSIEDQNVKYKIKDQVVSALTPLLCDAVSKEEAIDIVRANLNLICEVSDNVLASNGYTYTSSANITNEYFPTRSYDNVTLESGDYDSLIIYLGSGVGNNWWCVVYPPLCFVGGSNETTNVVYRSKLYEVIENFFGS